MQGPTELSSPRDSTRAHPHLAERPADETDDGPIERMLRIAVVSRGPRCVARLGAAPAVRNLLIDRGVVHGVVARVEEDRRSGETGGRGWGGHRRDDQHGRRDAGNFQDFASGNGFSRSPGGAGRSAHRAMVAIPRYSLQINRLICKARHGTGQQTFGIEIRDADRIRPLKNLLRVRFCPARSSAMVVNWFRTHRFGMVTGMGTYFRMIAGHLIRFADPSE